MSGVDQSTAIADDCLVAYERIEAHGTDTMKILMRALLFEIGKEIARQHKLDQKQTVGQQD